MEFKGTKGKWEADEDHVGSLDDSIHGNIICIIPEHYYPDSRKNWKANALLISKAPELLQDEIENYSYMEDLAMLIPAECWTEEFRDRWNAKMHKTEKLIKEATTL